jgi:hypothetical protein
VNQLKDYRVLQGVAGHLVNADNGVIVCACGDCDQERNYTNYLSGAVHDRMHRLQLNGGPLSLARGSPLYTDRDDDGTIVPVGSAMRVNIRNAVILKGIKKLVLVAHVPCGAALLAAMGVDEVLEALIAAKTELIASYGETLGITVACFLHVDWSMLGHPSKPPRTYFVSRQLADRWLADPPPLARHSRSMRETPTHVGS